MSASQSTDAKERRKSLLYILQEYKQKTQSKSQTEM